MPESRDPDASDYKEQVRAALEPFIQQFSSWERDGHLPAQFFAVLGEAGLFRERWAKGAVGGHYLIRALLDELAPLNAGAALALSIHSEVFTHALARFGSEAQRPLLEGALAGQVIGCFAATESGGGSDLPGLRATAAQTGDSWHLQAEKRYITNVGRATHVLVLANSVTGRHGLCLFCVPLDRPGVTIRGFYKTLGVCSADTAALSIDTVLEPTDVIGRPGAGLLMALRLLDFERLAGASALVAGAENALKLAGAWARRRQQFGVRLFDHQALRHRLADRWADVYAARAALDATCHRLGEPSLPHVEIAATKLLAARAASLTADETLQIFGARGYTTAYPVEQMYRDVRLTRIGGGTDEMMREIIAASLDVADSAAAAQLDMYEAADIAAVPELTLAAE
jgi:alkylation response protein AidB-like acyl-CoA dehydrogenase